MSHCSIYMGICLLLFAIVIATHQQNNEQTKSGIPPILSVGPSEAGTPDDDKQQEHNENFDSFHDNDQQKENYREALSCVFLKSFAYGLQKAVEEYAVNNRDASLSRAVRELNVAEYIRDYCPASAGGKKTKLKLHHRNKSSNNSGDTNTTIANLDTKMQQLWRQQEDKILKLEQHFENAQKHSTPNLSQHLAHAGNRKEVISNEKQVEQIVVANHTLPVRKTDNGTNAKSNVKSRHYHFHAAAAGKHYKSDKSLSKDNNVDRNVGNNELKSRTDSEGYSRFPLKDKDHQWRVKRASETRGMAKKSKKMKTKQKIIKTEKRKSSKQWQGKRKGKLFSNKYGSKKFSKKV